MKISELKRLTLDDLRKVTWDYLSDEIVGEFDDRLILCFLWEVKECEGKVDPTIVQRCNVAEGWVESREYDVPPLEPKRDENGDLVITKIDCEIVVDILDRKGNVIVTLEREKDGS